MEREQEKVQIVVQEERECKRRSNREGREEWDNGRRKKEEGKA